LTEQVLAQITFEIEQVDHLLTIYADLLERIPQRASDPVELAAGASVLHSFYNGLENIFLVIAQRLDQQVPDGLQWHRDLLVQMTRETATRDSVISVDLARQLTDYLGFRHFYRHSYSFFLEWSKLSRLVAPLPEVWTRVKEELHDFLNSLSADETPPPGNPSEPRQRSGDTIEWRRA